MLVFQLIVICQTPDGPSWPEPADIPLRATLPGRQHNPMHRPGCSRAEPYGHSCALTGGQDAGQVSQQETRGVLPPGLLPALLPCPVLFAHLEAP